MFKTLHTKLFRRIPTFIKNKTNLYSKKIKEISTPNAPKAIGPYSQAVKYGSQIWVSGQLGIVPETGELAGPETSVQAIQALENIESILEKAGIDHSYIVKTTVLLDDINDFQEFNEVYSKFFEGCIYPARACYEVSKLPKEAKIEIEVLAVSACKNDGINDEEKC